MVCVDRGLVCISLYLRGACVRRAKRGGEPKPPAPWSSRLDSNVPKDTEEDAFDIVLVKMVFVVVVRLDLVVNLVVNAVGEIVVEVVVIHGIVDDGNDLLSREDQLVLAFDLRFDGVNAFHNAFGLDSHPTDRRVQGQHSLAKRGNRAVERSERFKFLIVIVSAHVSPFFLTLPARSLTLSIPSHDARAPTEGMLPACFV